jgi:hypothetical protein
VSNTKNTNTIEAALSASDKYLPPSQISFTPLLTKTSEGSALRFEQSEFDDMARHDRLSSSLGMMSRDLTQPELHRALLAIDVFPRCALLLTIFEKLPVKDAALLLNADERLVLRAQATALIELTRNLAPVEAGASRSGELSIGVGCRF